jgi:hypothetical protein
MSKINVSNLINAYNATEKAFGTFTKEVAKLYSGCKVAADYVARRKEVNTAIDQRFGDTVDGKALATKVKAKTNTVLNRLLPDGVKLGERKGGRKATGKATGKAATGKAEKATGKATEQRPTIQAATISDVMAALAHVISGKTKVELSAIRSRIDAMFATAITNAK